MQREFPLGLIAGGMVDGNIHVWDPSKMMADDPAPLLMTAEQHSGPINGLQFNPHKEWSHSLASGGSDGELFVMSLERPDAPVSYPGPDSPKHVGGITKVAWNTATHHILVSGGWRGATGPWSHRVLGSAHCRGPKKFLPVVFPKFLAFSRAGRGHG